MNFSYSLNFSTGVYQKYIEHSINHDLKGLSMYKVYFSKTAKLTIGASILSLFVSTPMCYGMEKMNDSEETWQGRPLLERAEACVDFLETVLGLGEGASETPPSSVISLSSHSPLLGGSGVESVASEEETLEQRMEREIQADFQAFMRGEMGEYDPLLDASSAMQFIDNFADWYVGGDNDEWNNIKLEAMIYRGIGLGGIDSTRSPTEDEKNIFLNSLNRLALSDKKLSTRRVSIWDQTRENHMGSSIPSLSLRINPYDNWSHRQALDRMQESLDYLIRFNRNEWLSGEAYPLFWDFHVRRRALMAQSDRLHTESIKKLKIIRARERLTQKAGIESNLASRIIDSDIDEWKLPRTELDREELRRWTADRYLSLSSEY